MHSKLSKKGNSPDINVLIGKSLTALGIGLAVVVGMGLIIFLVKGYTNKSSSGSNRSGATATTITHQPRIDYFTAPVGAWSAPVVILGADWDFDTYADFQGNSNPKIEVLVNQGRFNETPIMLGGKKPYKRDGIYTICFKSHELGPIVGRVVQIRRY